MKGECPAFGETCNYCLGKNHFEQVCFKKQHDRSRSNAVKRVDTVDSDSETETDYDYESDSDTSTDYINLVRECNHINSVAVPDTFAEMLIKPNDRPVTFQITCGAKVNTIEVHPMCK